MRNKKIVIIVPKHWSAMMGGSQYQVKCLLTRLAQPKHGEIYYLTKQFDSSYNPRGYQLVPIGTGNVFKPNRFAWDALPLMRLLKALEPDVIYQRVGCAYTGIAAYYAKYHRCKMLWHIAHDNDVTPMQLKPWKRYIFNFIDKKILEYGIRNSHTIIAQSRQQTQYLKKFYHRDASAVIPNFHPFPEEIICKDKSIKIVWVANFKSWKQPEYFIRLARDLDAMQLDVECIMIGKPSRNTAWQKHLEAKIRFVKRLKYYGELDISEVNSILSRAHIFVNTSRFEGFANTFIQAWMRKVPVVSLHWNIDNLFDKYRIGFYSGDYPNMLKNVLTLVNNPQLRCKMGEYAQQYANKYHSLDNINTLLGYLSS